MHLFTVGESVTKGLRIHRDRELPYVAQSVYSAVMLILGDSILNDAEFIHSLPQDRGALLEQASVELGKTQGLTTIALEYGHPYSQQALLRVETMAGEGGHVALLPPARTDFRSGDVGRKYDLFPSDGVQFLGSEEDAAAAHGGLYPEMDALLILNHGGQFRLERTGDLRDQHGEKAPAAFDVRWDGRRRELMMRPAHGRARPEAWGSVAAYTTKVAHRRVEHQSESRAAVN